MHMAFSKYCALRNGDDDEIDCVATVKRRKFLKIVFTGGRAQFFIVLKCGWLVGCFFLCHINPPRLFNAKSCSYVY